MPWKRVLIVFCLIVVAETINGMSPHGEQVVDMFRVTDGKVCEHWDVIQPIPGDSSNPYGTFYAAFAASADGFRPAAADSVQGHRRPSSTRARASA